jgi:putative membrane protein
MNWFLLAKAMHIIGFVSWFAGLLYLVRLFIYHQEANESKPPAEAAILKKQYALMERRLYTIITNPAMILTWIGGLTMLTLGYFRADTPDYLLNGWLHLKLFLVILLTGYNHYCKALMGKLANDTNTISSEKMRGLNEIPTIFLAAIVLLAVFKSLLHFGIAFAGLFAFGFALFMGIRFYKKQRAKKGWDK